MSIEIHKSERAERAVNIGTKSQSGQISDHDCERSPSARGRTTALAAAVAEWGLDTPTAAVTSQPWLLHCLHYYYR